MGESQSRMVEIQITHLNVGGDRKSFAEAMYGD